MFRSGFGFNRGLHDGRSFFVLLHSTAAPGVQRWNEYLAALESCLSVSPTAIHIFAVTDGGGPDASQRMALATITAQRNATTHVFTGDRLVRGIVTAFRWIGGKASAHAPAEFVDVCSTAGYPPAVIMSELEPLLRTVGTVDALTAIRAAQL